MKIILIGFMGAGKTSVGKVLSEKIKIPLIEMDEIILKFSGRKTIKEIFANDGEKHFRILESKVCQGLKNKDDLIISTGGGVIGDKKNIENLKNNGLVFYLKTSFLTINKRLANDNGRPLFTNKTAT
jgi:shikimate kinase